ncbi:MAG: hypothetical protein QXP80_06745 [Zestosphaera sp.]
MFKRRLVEEALLVVGIIGLLLIFQPFSIVGYTAGWVLVMSCTLIYVVFTLVPQDSQSGKGLAKLFVKTLLTILFIIILFTLFSIWLTPNIV